MRTILTLSAAMLLAATAASAQRQDRQGVPEKDQRPPTLMPLPDQGEGSGSSLSDRLSKSGGVIRPPADPDPQMKQPTPPTGPNSMPVLPPPGTPGGDPTVKPK